MHHKTSKIKKIAIIVLMVINIVAALLLILSTFSGTLPPQDYPRLSVLPLFFPYFLLANIILVVCWLFIKRKMALISAVAMLLCINDIRSYFPLNLPNNTPDGTIKLMSLNTGGTNGKQEDELIQYLIDSQADIICLQEMFWKTAWLTRDEMKKHYPYISTISDRGKMSCVSKYPIVGTEQIKYPSEGNMSVAFYIKVDADTLLVVNNHFQSYQLGQKILDEYKDITKKKTSMAEREKNSRDVYGKIIRANKKRGPQVEVVNDYIEKNFKRHTVACGDFNEPSTGYAHYLLTKQLNDTYTRTGNGFGFTYSSNKIHFRIDHILCSEFIEPFNCTIDKTCELSDHFPIICDLKLK